LATPLYKPIYATFMAVFISLVLGVFIWIIGSLLGLPYFFEEGYRTYPSGLLIVFIAMVVLGASAFVTSFTKNKWYGLMVLLIGTIVGFIVLVILDWVIDQWDTTTILVMALMMMIIVIGVVFNMFGKTVPVIATWAVLSLIVTVVIMRWIESLWGTSFLYWLIAVIVVVLYAVVGLSYVLIPKRMLEA
jgi:hypothetical protein